MSHRMPWSRMGVALVLGVVLVAMGVAGGCHKPLLSPIGAAPTPAEAAADVWAWDRCLNTFVRDGKVDYRQLAAEPRILNSVLARLAEPNEPSDMGPARAARLINAYNAMAMRAGLEEYLKTGGNLKRVVAPSEEGYRFKLHGQEVTLADVRKRLSEGEYRDARVLMALCPAVAGVPLSEQAYQADLLDRQLTAIAVRTMDSPDAVRIDHENRTLFISDAILAHRAELEGWYERRTGSRNAPLIDVLLELSGDAARRRLNAAVGYPIAICPESVKLNICPK